MPCVEQREDSFWVSTLRPCGDAETCCIKRTYYCVDSDGVITIPLEYRVQDGECSQDAFSPCPMMGTGKGDPTIPIGDQLYLRCVTRGCISEP